MYLRLFLYYLSPCIFSCLHSVLLISINLPFKKKYIPYIKLLYFVIMGFTRNEITDSEAKAALHKYIYD